jgi:hypothetical protein
VEHFFVSPKRGQQNIFHGLNEKGNTSAVTATHHSYTIKQLNDAYPGRVVGAFDNSTYAI